MDEDFRKPFTAPPSIFGVAFLAGLVAVEGTFVRSQGIQQLLVLLVWRGVGVVQPQHRDNEKGAFLYFLLLISRLRSVCPRANFAERFLVLRRPRLDIGARTADCPGHFGAGCPLPGTDHLIRFARGRSTRSLRHVGSIHIVKSTRSRGRGFV